jgi:hypothetical protein
MFMCKYVLPPADEIQSFFVLRAEINPCQVSDSIWTLSLLQILPNSASSSSHNIFHGHFSPSAGLSIRSSIIGEFAAHIQVMDDISRGFLSGRRLRFVSERKGCFYWQSREQIC